MNVGTINEIDINGNYRGEYYIKGNLNSIDSNEVKKAGGRGEELFSYNIQVK